jgi:hypothetical protein
MTSHRFLQIREKLREVVSHTLSFFDKQESADDDRMRHSTSFSMNVDLYKILDRDRNSFKSEMIKGHEAAMAGLEKLLTQVLIGISYDISDKYGLPEGCSYHDLEKEWLNGNTAPLNEFEDLLKERMGMHVYVVRYKFNLERTGDHFLLQMFFSATLDGEDLIRSSVLVPLSREKELSLAPEAAKKFVKSHMDSSGEVYKKAS